AEDGIRDLTVTGVQTCALPIWASHDLDDLRLWLRLLQQGAHVLAAEAVAAHHVVDEFDDLGALQVEATRDRILRMRARRSAGERSEERRVGKECGGGGWRAT